MGYKVTMEDSVLSIPVPNAQAHEPDLPV
jgi:hypothetical protein